jgi:hypothetical protein
VARAATPQGVTPQSPTGHCAEAIFRSAAELVRQEIERVKAALAAELTRLDDAAAAERAGCVEALEALLVKHDLPETVTTLRLVEKEGSRYLARLSAKTPFGLEAEIDLEIPQSHRLNHPLRVHELLERLEVQAPEEGGWLRKEVKLRPQRLDKDYVAELVFAPDDTTLRLRTSSDGTGGGYDVNVRKEPPRVRMVRIGEGDLPPFELDEVDAEKVVQLEAKLKDACADLPACRRALVDARLGGQPLRDVGSPRELVEKVIEALTPTTKEISKRSLAQTELVLKRQLGDGRREEIFVSKEALRQKLMPLSQPARALFSPLGLGEDALPPPPPQPGTSKRPTTIEVKLDDSGVTEVPKPA